MNIKKQIRNLYLYEVISGLQIADALWVFFMMQRGFSLAQAGIAEGVFHFVSMCCEIPSGMLSDTLGRRRTLILAGVISGMSSFLMIVSDYFFLILCAMGLNAFSYNLVSGTREALTYDSLLQSGMEEAYLKISSRQEAIYLGLNAITYLMSALTVTMGYRAAYGIGIIRGFLCSWAAWRLEETQLGKRRRQKNKWTEHFSSAWSTMKKTPQLRINMLFSGLLSAAAYIVLMFMQEHVVDCGLQPELIGIPLLFLSASMMAGAFLAEKTGNISLRGLLLAIGLATGCFLALSGSEVLWGAVLAAGMTQMFAEVAAVRLGNENQRFFASEHRATMVSVESMVYSVFMSVLSPAAGMVGKYVGISVCFQIFGFLVGIAVLVLLFLKRKECDRKRKK